MGIETQARLVVGVRASDLRRVDQSAPPVTRYDTHTGRPYTTTETVREVFRFGRPVADDNLPGDWPELTGSGLTVFSAGVTAHEGRDFDLFVVGLEVTPETDANGDVREVDEARIGPSRELVRVRLAGLGYAPEMAGQVRLFLVAYVG